ncbi:unnamed protein product [marine sediment metagenome]|uniref:Plasmid pRiA4b Orf3-like domain-containing protein n=1 Tax=marine sediment metagenome TaxID=412755 RepID=X1KKI4_9ZZZZ
MRGGKVIKKKFDKVYQFKITLKDIKPPIWRKIQVPKTYTFYDLHVAIQDSMGWFGYAFGLYFLPVKEDDRRGER